MFKRFLQLVATSLIEQPDVIFPIMATTSLDLFIFTSLFSDKSNSSSKSRGFWINYQHARG